VVNEHVEKVALHDLVITPGHADRKASAEFERSVKRLRADGHYSCWVCGSTDGIQVHHFGCEWSLQSCVDYDKLKTMLLTFDIYGYSKLLEKQPLTNVDDIRNMMCLCQEHHTGTDSATGDATGIHGLVFPMWIAQAVCGTGRDPVPQEGETIETAESRMTAAGVPV